MSFTFGSVFISWLQVMALMYTDRLKLAVLKRERSEAQGSETKDSAEKDSYCKPPDWNNVVQKYLEVGS